MRARQRAWLHHCHVAHVAVCVDCIIDFLRRSTNWIVRLRNHAVLGWQLLVNDFKLRLPLLPVSFLVLWTA